MADVEAVTGAVTADESVGGGSTVVGMGIGCVVGEKGNEVVVVAPESSEVVWRGGCTSSSGSELQPLTNRAVARKDASTHWPGKW